MHHRKENIKEKIYINIAGIAFLIQNIQSAGYRLLKYEWRWNQVVWVHALRKSIIKWSEYSPVAYN